MERIIECVPNISDGIHPEVYQAVANVCEKVPGVRLLDVDPGVATNRTVITFAGPPEAVCEAAFQVIKKSKELIDMRQHKGAHPRMGATDVCPFVPVSGVSMEECAELARKLGKRVGEELGVWVYLYEAAASTPARKNLAAVREGEYESLKGREGKSQWTPDFGPAKLDPAFGAIAIGARKFLVAFNINMNSTNKKLASDIAQNIRESGRNKRESYPDGQTILGKDGLPEKVPGLFANCKATAWVIPEYGRAQITMNLTDVDVTPIHTVFDEVERQANARGMRVTGSEIVGLVPRKALTDTGKYYLAKQGLSIAVSTDELVKSAILSLGLNDVSRFDPAEKIIESRFARKGRLVDLTVEKFSDILASDAPAPGGGSVAALCGTLASSLTAMVGNLTFGKKDFRPHWTEMENAALTAQGLKEWFLSAIDHDTDAFGEVMKAMAMPKKTEQEKRERADKMEEANKLAATVPLKVLEKTKELVPLLEIMASRGNSNCASDAGVASFCLLTAAEGASMNVRINLKGISDDHFKTDCQKRLDSSLTYVRDHCKQIAGLIEQKL